MYVGMCCKYGCSFMSKNTDTAFAGVLFVEHSGLSVIGWYILCSFGLKYILANAGFSTSSFCNSILDMVEYSNCVLLVSAMYPKLISICVKRCLALIYVGLVSNLQYTVLSPRFFIVSG